MTFNQLVKRVAHIEAMTEEQRVREEKLKPVLYPFKIIRYGPEGNVWYETPEEKLKPLAPGEERKVLHLQDRDVAGFYQELKKRAGRG
jgi:hypothetical protein